MIRLLAALVAVTLLASVASAQHCGGHSNVSYGHSYHQSYHAPYVAPYVAPVIPAYVAPVSLLYVLPGTPTAAFYASSVVAAPVVAQQLAVPAAYTAPAAAPVDAEYQQFLKWKANKALKEDAKVEPEKLDKQYISVLFR